MRFRDTPVLIPNTMVKTKAADDTMLATIWESRWLPDYKNEISESCFRYMPLSMFANEHLTRFNTCKHVL